MPSRAVRAAEAVRSRARSAPPKPVEAEAHRVRFVPPRNSRRWMKRRPSSRKAGRKRTRNGRHPSRSPGRAAEAERKDSAVGTQRKRQGPEGSAFFMPDERPWVAPLQKGSPLQAGNARSSSFFGSSTITSGRALSSRLRGCHPHVTATVFTPASLASRTSPAVSQT